MVGPKPNESAGSAGLAAIIYNMMYVDCSKCSHRIDLAVVHHYGNPLRIRCPNCRHEQVKHPDPKSGAYVTVELLDS
ncbi:MAG: hypothetical protein ACLP0J_25500 [Solirubrobacteraceae bacterium]